MGKEGRKGRKGGKGGKGPRLYTDFVKEARGPSPLLYEQSPSPFLQEITGKGPGLYTDFGKKARDLLYRDYQRGHKFTVTTFSPSGVAISSSATKKGNLFLADVITQLKIKNITADIKVDRNSSLFTTITMDETVAGLKTILSFRVPDLKIGKLGFQYLHDFAGISTSVELTANPIVNFSATLGTNEVALGTDLSFDTKTGNFTKWNVGFRLSNPELIGSLALNDKGDSLIGSYYYIVNPLTNTAVVTEIAHRFSTSSSTITVGTQHALDPLTMVKMRLNYYGKVNALIQHEWRPRSLITMYAEVDTWDLKRSPKIGLALALKP